MHCNALQCTAMLCNAMLCNANKAEELGGELKSWRKR